MWQPGAADGCTEPGCRVQVDFDGRGSWLPAVVTSNHGDGTVNVLYDDGSVEERVPPQYLRAAPPPSEGSPPWARPYEELTLLAPPPPDALAALTPTAAAAAATPGGGSAAPAAAAAAAAVELEDAGGALPFDQTWLPEGHALNASPPARPTSSPAPAPAASTPPAAPLVGALGGPGARVSANYAGLGFYHPATITAVHLGERYDLLYDDGLTEERIPQAFLAIAEEAGGSRAGSASGGRRASSSAARERAPAQQPSPHARQRARTPPRQPPAPAAPNLEEVRLAAPAPARVEDMRAGCAAIGNWQGLGHWHPCIVLDVLPNGSFLLQYDDGLEEEAPPENLRPAASAGGAGAFGGGAFGGGSGPSGRRTPPLPRRSKGGRRASAPGDYSRESERARREAEAESARVEVIKAKAEDRQWAEAHGIAGERGIFRGMIIRYREKIQIAPALTPAPVASEMPISVFVRCRPMLPNELKANDFDVVTPGCASVSSSVVLHEPKVMVDLSKAMNNHAYKFDGVFGEDSTNREIFEHALRPMVSHLLESRGGHGTCFAYGQTGSGKTVTMSGLGNGASSPDNATGLYGYLADEIFSYVDSASSRGTTLTVRCGFLEIYRGKCFDLLARRQPVEVMEDEFGQQQVVGLQQMEITCAQQLVQLVARSERTTRATAQNEASSRSHAILQISVLAMGNRSRQGGTLQCKLSLIDLAGSEWAAKAQSDDRGNRLDGAEINKSLLCLKECIRALGSKGSHVPFRGSKLTQVLKDSFVGKDSRTVMIANISPCSASCDHSLNTLRYAQRVKDWQAQQQPAEGENPRSGGASRPPPLQSSEPPARVSPKVQRQRTDSDFGDQVHHAPEETDEAPRQPSPSADADACDLARSLRWSPEQLRADQAATRLLQAEEALLAAHVSSTKQTRELLTASESLIELGQQSGSMESFASRLRELEKKKEEISKTVAAALLEYDRCCAQEDEARLCVKSLGLSAQ